MSKAEPSVPLDDDEYLYRRIPVKPGWFQDGVVSPEAFKPTKNDTTGLSLERAIFCSPEEAAAHGTNPSGYYIARLKAADIRMLGLDVVPKPSAQPGHAEVPELTFGNRKADQAQEWQLELAEIAAREGVLGPYPCDPFRPVESSVSLPQQEERIIRFWKERQIYEKSLAARAGAPPFVFYEGPPTANGKPHPGHCLTRAIKDLFPRYKTMRGFRADRKAGWDTHGLPVEVEVCKELGIHAKEEIEAYGVEPFIHRCVESVFRYMREWEELTERLGFWIHLDEAYVTFHQSYVESVWWALKTLFDRGLLYQGHKIVWWWAQGGTALSSGEVGQGYREVSDPSVYVRFPLVSPPENLRNADLLVWTTTPWTLPANQFAAVKPDLGYSIIRFEGDSRAVVLASALVEQVAKKAGREPLVEGTVAGEDLVGLRYVPPFDYYYNNQEFWLEAYPLAAAEAWPMLRDRLGQATPADEAELPEILARHEAAKAQHRKEFAEEGECPWLRAWRVWRAGFVTTDTGTGIVHIAPAFGEDDFDLFTQIPEEQGGGAARVNKPLLCPVASDGRFTAEAPDYQGRWVKDCDRDIIRDLKTRGLLFHQEQCVHEYPFCWRAEEDPLIQYPRKSWFIRTTQFREKMLENNRRIHWLPEHIRDGRFGNFLESNVDWALSRERYWGTPLPIWVCEETGYMEAVGSYEELWAKPGAAGFEAWEKAKRENPDLPEHLKIHKPYIDAVTYDSPKAALKRMRRVGDVIDCWFDSGAMPFAQWGYPGQAGSAERFFDQFPADFIGEALDQTRGWFYSLLAISTLLFSEEEGSAKPQAAYPHPFRNCIVLGLMLGEDGQKMSKSKRNYREPGEIFDRYGADALRWYFFSNQPPWTSIRYSEQAIKETIPEFLLRLWNVYSFFVIYASIDGFDPVAEIPGPAGQLTPAVLARAPGYRGPSERSELDRWILSELSRTSAAVVERMDDYDNYNACARLVEFVDALSNWYVRRSRERFWSAGASAAKSDAHWTLYECLLTTSKLIAPFVPFLAEAMWQNLAVAAFRGRPSDQQAVESVHLCDYPAGRAPGEAGRAEIDEELSARMGLVREIVSLGRSARMGARLKVRQPLARVEVVLADRTHQAWLEEHAGLICDELNVKQVEFPERADQYITYTVLPDLKRLGPRLGKRLPAVRKVLAETDAGGLLAELESQGRITLALGDSPVVLDAQDVQIRLQAKPGWAAAQGHACVVVLSTELSDTLVREGIAREAARVVNDRRKDMGCQFTDRIEVGLASDSAELRSAIEQFREYLQGETLAVATHFDPIAGAEPADVEIADYQATLYVKVLGDK
jgi:isoleucyl-tRNA synthetase